MKIDLRPQQSGKTTQIIKEAAEGFFYIVCFSQKEALRISKQADDMGLDIPFPLTYTEFISGHYHGNGIKGFLIDNADMLLQRIATNVPVIGITLTEPNAKLTGTGPRQDQNEDEKP